MRVKKLSLRICDGAQSTVHSSSKIGKGCIYVGINIVKHYQECA